MAKLYFRHGAVSSAKTLNLLAVSHNYKSQGKDVLLMKPAMDVRFGKASIKSRAGLEQDADVLINEDTDLFAIPSEQRANISCVLVDEAQFLSPRIIDQLRTITFHWKVPVIAYGLRTDFRANLFPGSQRLMEVADTIEEVKTTCHFCNKKAVFNLKHVNGVADCTGPAVQLGAEERYFPTCFGCYRASLLKAEQMPEGAHWLVGNSAWGGSISESLEDLEYMEQQKQYIKESTKQFDLSREFGETGLRKNSADGIGSDSAYMVMPSQKKTEKTASDDLNYDASSNKENEASVTKSCDFDPNGPKVKDLGVNGTAFNQITPEKP